VVFLRDNSNTKCIKNVIVFVNSNIATYFLEGINSQP
jgi:hypothetical protein